MLYHRIKKIRSLLSELSANALMIKRNYIALTAPMYATLINASEKMLEEELKFITEKLIDDIHKEQKILINHDTSYGKNGNEIYTKHEYKTFCTYRYKK